jgi:NAD(P)-dependent dehydrogenase (short-subunit alcohol dehydrogenase family)
MLDVARSYLCPIVRWPLVQTLHANEFKSLEEIGSPFGLPQLSMTIELKDQVAVVTGAARGIGRAISRQLASMGAHVVLAARDTDQLERVKREIEADGGVAGIVQLELTDEFSVAKLAGLVESQYRRCDVLVNNAGIGLMGHPLHEMAPIDWDMLMGTNLRGPYLMIRALAPLMIAAKSGHIVNISSLAGHNPLADGAAYSASKWGLNGLTDGNICPSQQVCRIPGVSLGVGVELPCDL